jgi:hypothetical protein
MGREQRDKMATGGILKDKTMPLLHGEMTGDDVIPIKAGSVEHLKIIPVEYNIIISTGMNTQAEIRTLNDMAKKGFEHYYTMSLYGSTEKMYFRKY